ncbi:MAG: pirin family protein [Pigmentiphaga sp.]
MKDTQSPNLQRIAIRQAELGAGFQVGRALPTRERRMVGAWCFLDHLGPVEIGANGAGMHVGAHPHTCLQTFTWMIEGEIMHRDSLGTEQVVRPRQVNLMTAGHGISHTEDSLPTSARLHAAQLWIALPPEDADVPPAFDHYPEMPVWQQEGVTLTLLAGELAGHLAPTRIYSPLLGVDLHSAAGGRLVLPLDAGFEHGLLPLEGGVSFEGQDFGPQDFLYLEPGRPALELELYANSRLLLLGGQPFGQPITMWWNFVGHSRAAVSAAQADWEAGSERFGTVSKARERLLAPRIPW